MACGIGKLTEDCLQYLFKDVDMFDSDAQSVEAAKALKEKVKVIDRVEQASMKDFKKQHHYNLILVHKVNLPV